MQFYDVQSILVYGKRYSQILFGHNAKFLSARQQNIRGILRYTRVLYGSALYTRSHFTHMDARIGAAAGASAPSSSYFPLELTDYEDVPGLNMSHLYAIHFPVRPRETRVLFQGVTLKTTVVQTIHRVDDEIERVSKKVGGALYTHTYSCGPEITST